jgi:hypothetical protein
VEEKGHHHQLWFMVRHNERLVRNKLGEELTNLLEEEKLKRGDKKRSDSFNG